MGCDLVPCRIVVRPEPQEGQEAIGKKQYDRSDNGSGEYVPIDFSKWRLTRRQEVQYSVG